MQQVGGISQADIEATLNMGVGMVALVAPEAVEAALASLAGNPVEAWVCGEVRQSARRMADAC